MLNLLAKMIKFNESVGTPPARCTEITLELQGKHQLYESCGYFKNKRQLRKFENLEASGGSQRAPNAKIFMF